MMPRGFFRITLPGILFFFLTSSLCAGQHFHADSLYRAVENTPSDSAKARLYNQIAESWLKNDDFKAIGDARKSLVHSRLSKARVHESASYHIIGAAYDNLERFSDALEYYFYSLPIAEEIRDTNLLLKNYNRIGIIYSYKKNHESALKYFDLFTKLSEDLNLELFMARGYNNLGICYKNLGDAQTAANYYYKALEIFTEHGLTVGIISSYTNLGVIASLENDFEKSLEFYEKAIHLARRENNNYAISISKVNIGEIYFNKSEFQTAIQHYDSARIISEKSEHKRQLIDAYDGLYRTYEKLGNYRRAYEFLNKYLSTKDSIFQSETDDKLSLAEKNYQALKAEKQFELKQKQDEIQLLKQEKELSTSRLTIWALIIISLFVVVSAFILYKRFIEKKNANALLQRQRDEITHQKKEITDSINYAHRIQRAILPSSGVMSPHFTDYFIIYQPKDIVSGDFYWFTRHGNNLIVAAADCTGHGVPGAMVSVICSTALSRSIKEFNLSEPGKILDKTTELVTESFTTSESEVQDGMDISLCLFDKKNMELSWAGANNPVYIFRNKELTELKPDKQPIGNYHNRKPFTTQKISLEKGDLIYIFSDGFADQFGGPEGKKFKYSNFKTLLQNIAHQPAEFQKKEIQKIFSEWKGTTEQTDDVCIIGMRV